jgi:hypothetical protein
LQISILEHIECTWKYEEISDYYVNEIKEHLKGYSYDEVRIAIVGDLVHQKITISNEQLIAVANFKRTC